jgi:uncharacterized protein involved in outer membrane biogenesis
MRHPLVKLAAAGSLLVFLSFTAVVLAWNAGYWTSGLIRLASWRSGRAIELRGRLRIHLFTRNPSLVADEVSIGNPPWSLPGITADIAKLTITFAPFIGSATGLQTITIDGAQLHLMRDSEGRANWQRMDPAKSQGRPLPMLRSLMLTNAHLVLVDERLHLAYDGGLSIAGPDSSQPLVMTGDGTLNQRAVSFRLTGDALPSASPRTPYAFDVDARSSDTHLSVRGSLPEPFDLTAVDASFEAHGDDLRDLYYLIGVRLPNTGVFRLQGRLARRGREVLYDNLKVTSGQSDVQGRISVTRRDGRARMQLDLTSTLLRLADVGLRAAGRDSRPTAALLFSDAPLITQALRRFDVEAKYTARRLLLSRIEVDDLSAPFTIEQGLVKATQVTGRVLGGKVELRLDADANRSPSLAGLDMSFTDLQLALFPHETEPPPYDGSMAMKLRVTGHGESLHALAASADGTFIARASQGGTLRASLAELMGVNLRGLGLILTRSKQDVPLRCATADFDIHAGVMQATRLFIDTDPVFVRGDGRVRLDTESLDLQLHGEPKSMRILRLKAPVLVQGTLRHPAFSIDVPNAKLKLVDRGSAVDSTDCTAVPAL